jgi:ABC-type transport system involved in Fe-S cluster assembly fused permease/ATPase subunit
MAQYSKELQRRQYLQQEKPSLRREAFAHQLSTILSADQILVVSDGHLVERGGHANLLGQNGVFARLYRTQFRAQAGELEPGADTISSDV